MAQKKAFEVEAWLKKPGSSHAVVLLYGPDRGLVSERGRAFAVATGLPLDDPFSVIRLDANEADRDQGRLIDEARTVSMFSERRLLWVRNAGGQKSLADDVKSLLASPPQDAIVLIEAGELKKGTAMRSAVEASPAGMALPCYADEARELDAMIDAELAKAGLSIDPDARRKLIRGLGGDRLASRGELEKLTLYAHGSTRIETADLDAMTGDVSALSIDDAVDCLLDGRVEHFDTLFTRHALNGSQAYTVLAAAMRHFQTLSVLQAQMAAGTDASSVVAGARPPIFFGRRKTVERALGVWPAALLDRSLSRLNSTILASRRRPDLAVPLARQAMVGIAIEGARLLAERSR